MMNQWIISVIGLWQEGDPYLDILEPGGNVGMIKVKYTGEYNEDGTPVRQIGPDAVSYTHLDVYKRQCIIFIRQPEIFSILYRSRDYRLPP